MKISKDVPWRVKCKRMVEDLYSIFSFGSEDWSWTQKTLDRIKGWETKAIKSSISLQKMRHGLTITRELGEWPGKWVQMGLPFLYAVNAENVWRAMGCFCDDRSNAVVDSLKRVFKARNGGSPCKHHA